MDFVNRFNMDHARTIGKKLVPFLDIDQYMRKNRLENDPYGRSMLAMFGMVKLWVRFINDVLADKEYERTARYIPYLNRSAQEIAEIFPDRQRIYVDRALDAGLMK